MSIRSFLCEKLNLEVFLSTSGTHCAYTKRMTSVSPDTLQQIMPYLTWHLLRQLRHLNGSKLARRQV